MQLMAMGKWSKNEKRWRMVVALRASGRATAAAPTEVARRPGVVRPKKSS